MENNIEARRHGVRLGVVFTAGAALFTAFTLAVIAGGAGAPWWLAIAILVEAGIGVGLILGSRIMGWLAVIHLVIAGGGGLISTMSDLAEAGSRTSALELGNALASTALFVWLCAVGTVGVISPQRRTTEITLRLVGACLAMIAICHLYFASVTGSFGDFLASFSGPLGGVSINLRLTGITVAGFPGWPLWHAALAVTGLVLTFAPRRAQRHTCRVLFVLLALLALLSLVSLLGGGLPGLAAVPMLLVWSTLLLPLYLTWWLTDNVS